MVKPLSSPQDAIWFDDEPPPGAKLEGQWQWEKQRVHSGKQSMARTGEGLHQHSFTGATKPLCINAGDKLFVYAYLDPKNPPKSIMLQYHDSTWEHRVYWGEDKCVLCRDAERPAALPGRSAAAHRQMDSP